MNENRANGRNSQKWPENAPRWAAYRAWTPDTDEAQAAAAFERRYGRPPTFIFEADGLLRLGPIPEGGGG
ncbi:MAG TPA: hypothetical protein ENJ31_01530 [Anaerolineae bacterium]|nr:hypothetical protein [Anaerolineae bacterium]